MAMNKTVWVTNHSGKMKGINSISTSCACNQWCQKRAQNKNSICSHCYATTYLKMRKALREHLEENVEVLTKRLLREDEIPVIRSEVFRFESFGDLHNAIHLENFIQIAKANPNTRFALWTKNDFVLKEVFKIKRIRKPDNLIIIVSSPFMNTTREIHEDYIDHVFTVYDKQFIHNNGIQINCGSRDCIGCQKCYHKNGNYYICEQLK